MIRFVLNIDPSRGAKNKRAEMQFRFTRGGGRKRFIGTSPAYQAYVDEVALRSRSEMNRLRAKPIAGDAIVCLSFVWPAGRVRGDIDSAVTSTLDGLKRSILASDDRQITRSMLKIRQAERGESPSVEVFAGEHSDGHDLIKAMMAWFGCEDQ
jgi:Holliday junction resolvase RusA-like endonuclease